MLPPDLPFLVMFFNKVLGLKVLPNQQLDHPIAQEINTCFQDFANGNIAYGEVRYKQLLGVANNLATIGKNLDKDNFRKFCKKIASANNYVGARFEVLICAALIKRNAKFISSERPDFQIFEKDLIGIECGSRTLDSKKIIENPEEIWRALRDVLFDKKTGKNHKIYATKTCALFIDWTYLFQIIMSFKESTQDNFDKLMKKISSEMNYGSLILFNYQYEKDKKEFSVNWGRYDNPDIHPTLNSFMDSFITNERRTVHAASTAFPQRG